MVYQNAMANPAHKYFANLETPGKSVTVITQNIDGLHHDAGSTNVLELHGSIRRNYCMKCNKFYTLDSIMKDDNIPYCNCGGIIKPDVVLYEEPLGSCVIEKSIEAISKADTLIIGGTSLTVYPAAGFIEYFRGRNLVLINKSETPADKKASLVIREPIGKVLENLVL